MIVSRMIFVVLRGLRESILQSIISSEFIMNIPNILHGETDLHLSTSPYSHFL